MKRLKRKQQRAVWTHRARGYGRAPLRWGDHLRGEALRGVQALADLLLDQVHGQGELLPAQLACLLGVRQAPVLTHSVDVVHGLSVQIRSCDHQVAVEKLHCKHNAISRVPDFCKSLIPHHHFFIQASRDSLPVGTYKFTFLKLWTNILFQVI